MLDEFGAVRFEQEAGRTGRQRVDQEFIAGQRGEAEHLEVERAAGQPPGRLDAVQPGHVDVDDSDIGSHFGGQLDRLQAVIGHTHQLNAVGHGQIGGDGALRERLVLDEEHPDRALIGLADHPHGMTLSAFTRSPALRGRA